MNLKRRSFVSAAIAVSAAASIAFGGGQQKKPNIIYILADDAGIGDFGCYGQKTIMTPNVDQLAKEGLKFSDHYSGSTVCAPSRSCLMTGQHTGHTRVRGNSSNVLLKEDITIPQVLKQAGYVSGCVGKWGLGNQGNSGAPNAKGFDFFYGYLNQIRAHKYYPDYMWKNGEKVEFPDNQEKRTDYCHDHFTTQGLQFIRENKDNPFFLYMAYTLPHVDLDVPEDSMEPYYKIIGKETPHKGSYRPHPTPMACFAGMISRLDRDVGRIKDLVNELGLAENTLIIFTSDNGATTAGGANPDFFDSNGPFRGIKRDLYDGGVRAPMIAWWPGTIKPGTETDHISAFWDVMPTLAELAGVPCPETSDGISMVPTLLGKPEEQKKHDYLYWEFYEKMGKQAVRMGNWKAVRLNVNQDPNGPIELYRITEDIGEDKNLAAEYPEVVEKMAQIMRDAHTPSPKYAFAEKKGKDKQAKSKAK